MRRRVYQCAVVLSASLAVCAVRRSLAQSFASPGDLVILQTNGDGGGGGDSVSLLDMSVTSSTSSATGVVTLSIAAANTINLPTGTLSYNGSSGLGLVLPDQSSVVNASHSGQITLAQDGHSLELGTYLAPVGTIDYFGLPYSPNGVTPEIAPRVVTVVNPSGNITEATTLTGSNDYDAIEFRQVTSLNGTQFWLAGNGPKSDSGDFGGLRYTTLDASSTTSLNTQDIVDLRTTTIYQGQLYGGSGSNNSPPGEHTLSQLGAGLPLAAPNWSPLPASGGGYANGTIFGNQSPCFVTLNDGVSVLYESDSTEGAVTKWVSIDGRWNYEGEIAFGKDQIENLAAQLNSNGTVSFFSDNNAGTNATGNIFAYTDTGGAGPMNLSGLTAATGSNGMPAYTPGSTIYQGITNTSGQTEEFWGLSFAPSASKAVENQIWGNLNGVTSAAGGSWSSSANWSAEEIPDASGSTATLGPALTSNASVTLDGTQTVGHVVFNDAAANYTLAAGTGGTLDIDNTDPNSSGVPSIFNSAGSQTISAPISLADGVTIANHYLASLNISGSIAGGGGMQVYGPGSLVLSGASTYAGPTIVHSGPVTITASGSLPVTTDLTVGDPSDTIAVGLTASVTFNASTGVGIRVIKLNSLTLASNGTVSLSQPSAIANRSVLVLGGLTFAGSANAWTGLLDLSANDMIVQGGNLADITNQIREGYNSGGAAWTGTGGITSTTAAANTTHLTALGVIQNNQGGSPLCTGANPFDGISPGASDILVKYTYYGDANLDGKVDASDYSLIDNGYLNHLTGWYDGDFNYDGVVNGSDFTLIDNAFNTQGAQLSDSLAAPDAVPTAMIAGPGTSAVPEPASAGILGILGIGFLHRRTRRNGPRP